jgi:hypothetical protein
VISLEPKKSDRRDDRICRADPTARRQALLLLVLGAIAGTLLLVGFERYWIPLHDWLLSEPGKFRLRVNLVLLVSAVLLSVPLLAFTAYLWSFGAAVLRAKQFPPPGYRVIRDTPVIDGRAAISRGRGLKMLALCLGVVAAVLWLLLWRLAWVL